MQRPSFARASLTRLALAAALVVAPAAQAAGPFSSMVVFGDSLSDTGNIYNALGRLYPFSPPYFEGRFSNGPVAVEHVAAGLGLGNRFYNFAFGGALTGADGALPGTGIGTQAAFYGSILQRYGAAADPGGLFVVWGGGNDLRDLIFDLPATLGEAVQAVDDVVANLQGVVTTLHGLGARSFLLPNMPDLGLTPDALRADKGTLGSTVTSYFNWKLAQTYSGLASQWQDETFYLFDTFGTQQRLLATAGQLGFTNLTTPCIDDLPDCNADQYAFWDDLHPTARVHQILGDAMLDLVSPPVALQVAARMQAVSAVPEPATLLTMAIGVVALLGAAHRRRSV